MNKILSFFSSVLNFVKTSQMSLQSLIFWIMAISNLGSERFWYFASFAIIFSGIGDILEQLRNLNKNNNE